MASKKFKNKRGETCDCIIGRDPNSRQPRLIRCKNVATYYWYEGTNIPAIVCDGCLERLKAKSNRPLQNPQKEVE